MIDCCRPINDAVVADGFAASVLETELTTHAASVHRICARPAIAAREPGPPNARPALFNGDRFCGTLCRAGLHLRGSGRGVDQRRGAIRRPGARGFRGRLRAVAEALQSGLRESDLLGRYGGGEFVICLPGCAAERAELPLQRIRSALVGLQPVEAAPFRKVTVSIGAALRRDNETIDDVIARADAALYDAKRAGRYRVVWAV